MSDFNENNTTEDKFKEFEGDVINSVEIPEYIGSVCFVGSMKFWDDMLIEAEKMYRNNKVVILPIKDTRSEIPEKDLRTYDKVIRAAIMMSDSVHVINKGGYIGKSTRSEIEFAKKNGKTITYLEEPMRIVTLCGSFKFTDSFNILNSIFTRSGILTLLPAFLNSNENMPTLTSDQIDNLHNIHYMKIDMSDIVLIVDSVTDLTSSYSYVGTDTLREVEYAKSKNKDIIYLSKFKSIDNIINYIKEFPK